MARPLQRVRGMTDLAPFALFGVLLAVAYSAHVAERLELWLGGPSVERDALVFSVRTLVVLFGLALAGLGGPRALFATFAALVLSELWIDARADRRLRRL